MAEPVEFKPLACAPVSEPTLAYRVVRFDDVGCPRFARAFRSDREKGLRPEPRELHFDVLRDGRSMYATLERCRAMWHSVRIVTEADGGRVTMGDHIAELCLEPGHGFCIENLGHVDGHITVWGDREALVAAVRAIYPADPHKELG